MQRLRDEFSIYAIDTGRICVAALNSRNVDYVADAIARVFAETLRGTREGGRGLGTVSVVVAARARRRSWHR